MWTFKELFELSQRSSESRNSVRLLTSTMSPMKIQDVDGLTNTLKISRENQNQPQNQQSPITVEFHLANSEAIGMIPEGQFQFFNLNGTEMQLAFINESLVVCGVPEHPQLACLVFVEYLKDVFSAKFDNLIIGIEREQLKDLNTQNLQENIHFHVEFGFVSHEEMKMILEQKCHTADLGCFVQEGFVYDQPISIPILNMSYSSWLTRANLLALDSARIRLGSSTLSSEDLNAYIHQWLNGSNKKLEHLAVYGSLRKRGRMQFDLDMSTVTEGLLVMPGSDKSQYQTELELKGATIKYEEGLDVTRASDGLLATLLYGKFHSGQNFFVFHVWQHLKQSSDASDASGTQNLREKLEIPDFKHPEDALEPREQEPEEPKEANQFAEVSKLVLDCLNKLKIGKSEKISHEKMVNMLGSEINNMNLMGCNPGEDFVYDKPITARSLRCDDSQWFSRKNLLELDSAKTRLRNSTLNSEDLNAFLHQWLNGSNSKLVHFGVVMAKTAEKLDMKAITDGILTMPGNESKGETRQSLNSLYFREAFPIPFECGLDIERDDGLQATLVLSETEFGQQVFAFVVWHQKDLQGSQKPSESSESSSESTESPAFVNWTLEKLAAMKLSEPVSTEIRDKLREKFIQDLHLQPELSHEGMRAVLKTSTEKKDIYFRPKAGFVYDMPITAASLQIHHSQWFARQNLLSLNCHRVILKNSTLTSEDLNAFVNQWLNSSNKTFEHLAVICENSESPLDINKITDGMLAMPESDSDKKKYWTSLHLPEIGQIPYEDGLDVERDDGVLGTVLVGKTKTGKSYFVFTAWNRLKEDVHQTSNV